MTAGTGITGQGHGGGRRLYSGNYPGGGGGGAGAVGGTPTSGGDTDCGHGGVGLQNNITGTNTYYAGGGGGACYQTNTGGAGGLGGGATGASGVQGTDGLGGGGAGGSNNGGSTVNATDGGNGIVIISYDKVNGLPNIQDGSIFYETDTNKSYVLYSGSWSEL